jgi:hydrogenase maturation factor
MILAAVDPEAKQEVSDALHNKGVEPVFVGGFTKEKKRLLFKEEKEMLFPRLADDCYARIIRKKA